MYVVVGFLQLRVKCSAMVENEAIPLIMRAANFFKVFENAALELIHTVIADIFHMNRCFFTAYATGAEGDDGFVVQRFFFALDDGRKFTEFFDAVVNGVFEGTDIDFKRITGIHHDHRFALIILPLIQPAFECLGIHGRRAAQLGLDQRVLHGDDFTLEPHQHAIERLLFRQAFFDRDVGKPGIGAQEGQKLIDGRASSCKKQINTLRTQQNRAFQRQFRA
jgi:hypothetical protein